MSTAVPNILVVDGDPSVREQLQVYLNEQQFDVTIAVDAASMGRQMQRQAVDLVVLDQALPGEDGLSVLRRMRGSNDLTPVIMTAERHDDVDRIIGLEMGADDFLGKPFNPRELLARINAVLRRHADPPTSSITSHDSGTVAFGPYTFDLDARTLTRSERVITLTSGEYAVLRVLVRHPRVPLSRERLMQLAHGRSYGTSQRSLDVQIARLRKLIESDPNLPRIIQTVWGVGYVYVPEHD